MVFFYFPYQPPAPLKKMSQSIQSVLAWFANRKLELASNTSPVDDIEKALQSMCVVPGTDSRSNLPGQISNQSFREISALLKQYESHNKALHWHYRPRIYTVLRLIDRLDVMDVFVSNNYMDSDLPFRRHLLPSELGNSKNRFLAFQDHCLTAAIDLEKGVEGRHLHFSGNGDEYFYVHRYLGTGGFG